MTTNMMNEEEIMLFNETAKLDRLIEGRNRKLQYLLASKTVRDPLLFRPKRYSVEMEFTPSTPNYANLLPQTESFIVEDGSIFRPTKLESSVVLTARKTEGQQGLAQFTLRYGNGLARNRQFDYFWSIYDSGSDREWQNTPQPSCFMLSGLLGPLWLQNRGVLGPGTEVSITVEPFLNASGVASGIIVEADKYKLHISMSGFEQKVAL